MVASVTIVQSVSVAGERGKRRRSRKKSTDLKAPEDVDDGLQSWVVGNRKRKYLVYGEEYSIY